MTWKLVAYIDRGGVTPIESFDAEADCRAAYREAMRNLADGSYYSDEVRDFAVKAPDHKKQPKAEEADAVAQKLMAQFEGTTRKQARKKGK